MLIRRSVNGKSTKRDLEDFPDREHLVAWIWAVEHFNRYALQKVGNISYSEQGFARSDGTLPIWLVDNHLEIAGLEQDFTPKPKQTGRPPVGKGRGKRGR